MATVKEIDQNEAQLRELGYDPAAPPEQALSTLRALRGTPSATDAAIARALGRIESADAAATLAEMEIGASGGPRREIRRALFRLRQRGIEPARAATEAASAPRTVPTAESGMSALLSPVDADGVSVAWLLKPRSGGGIRRLAGFVSETAGLLGASLTTISRKELRAERAALEQRAGVKLIEIDGKLGDFILCDAYRHTPEANRAHIGDFFASRAELTASAPPTDLAHPIYDEFAAEAVGEPSVELLREAEIGGWRLSATQVKPFANEVTEVEQSVLVVSRVQQDERINTVVERALGELLAGDNARRLRRHLEDSGIYFARTGKRAQAGWAAAAAAKIRDGAELRRIPFFVNFMRAQLGALLVEKQEQEKRETRLIMTPAEAMRAQQAAAARARQRMR
jgi:hypothetical protein